MNTLNSSNKNIKSKSGDLKKLDKNTNYITKSLRDIYDNLMYDFKNSNIWKQVVFFYFIFLLGFLVIIVTVKFLNTNIVLSLQININYYSTVVLNLFQKEHITKKEVDVVNNLEQTSLFYTHIYFYQIYSYELTLRNFTLMDINDLTNQAFDLTSLNDNIKNIFTGLGDDTKKFDLFSSVNNIISPTADNTNQYDPNYIVPIIYTFSPLLYQNLLYNGINLQNFYFMGYTLNSNQGSCDESAAKYNKNVYFKYPIYSDEWKKNITNNDIFDTILDPIGKCYLSQAKSNTETIKNSNWYYNYETSFINDPSKKTYSRMISLLKLGLNYDKQEFWMSLVSFKIKHPNGKTLILTFAQKVDRSIIMNYLRENSDGDRPFNFFSIINFPYSSSQTFVNKTKQTDVYGVDYNLDDETSMVINIPVFIANLFKYAMTPNWNIQSNTLSLTNTEINNIIEKNYTSNYYFTLDKNIFQLISFFRNFLNYAKYEKKYIKDNKLNTTDPIDKIKLENLNTKNFHRCSISNITSWTSSINTNDDSNYDCKQDYCFFKNCTINYSLYVTRSELNYIPNCYCLPVYCQDKFTITDSNYQNGTFYDVNSQYYDSNSNIIKCRINFYRKQHDNTPYAYNTEFSLNDLKFETNTSMYYMYMIDQISTQNVVKDIQQNIDGILHPIYIVYIVITAFIFIIFVNCMSMKIKTLQNRFLNIDLIIQMILKISKKDSDGHIQTEYNNNILDEKFEDEGENLNEDEDDNVDDVIDINEDKVQKYHEKYDSDSDYALKSYQSRKLDLNLLEKIKDELEKLGLSININDYKQRYSDEFQQLLYIIRDNLVDFKLDFNINSNIYESLNKLNKQYIELVKAKYCQDRIIYSYNNRTENSELNDINMNQINSSADINSNSQVSIDETGCNLSSDLIYEILSTEEMIDLSKCKSNFYFKEVKEDSLLNFYECIDSLLYDESNYTNELSDSEKLKNAINYYMFEIHNKWRDIYLEKLVDDKI